MIHSEFVLRLQSTVFLIALSAVACATEPPISLITTGWNAPTMGQFARDWQSMPGDLPLTGCVLTLHADSGNPDPLARTHSRDLWDDLDVDRSVDAMTKVPVQRTSLQRMLVQRMPDNYLLIKANPGDVPWDDDEGWKTIVDHYRIAATISRQTNLRGILVDFEPYSPPYRQFQYSRQVNADSLSFTECESLARKRGREVMEAIAEAFPKAEIYTFFLLSYLIDDHHYRGPSPIGRDDARWCRAGHSYGLLPAFVDGWLDRMPETMTLVDGCENAYWFTTEQQFRDCATGLRNRSPQLLSEENRDKYLRRLRVAFPIFLDAIHPTFAAEYTLQPQIKDRLKLLKRNLNAAMTFSDSRVWLYGERGRWWPEAGEQSLWRGKDVYPHWEESLPGVSRVLQDAVASHIADRKGSEREGETDKYAMKKSDHSQLNESVVPTSSQESINAIEIATKVVWQPSSSNDKASQVAIDGDQVTIRAAEEAFAETIVRVEPGQRYMVQMQVVQEGRGLTKMAVRWSRKRSSAMSDRARDVVAYPEPGDPEKPRTITAIVTVPDRAQRTERQENSQGDGSQERAIEMVIQCHALRQLDQSDGALFGNLMVGKVIESTPPAK